MPEGNINKVNKNDKLTTLTVVLLVLYGALNFLFGVFFFFYFIFKFEGFEIFGIPWMIGSTLLYIIGSFLFWNSAQQIKQRNRLGRQGAIFGIILVAFPTIPFLLNDVVRYTDEEPLRGTYIPLFWLFFNILLLVMLSRFKRYVKNK